MRASGSTEDFAKLIGAPAAAYETRYLPSRLKAAHEHEDRGKREVSHLIDDLLRLTGTGDSGKHLLDITKEMPSGVEEDPKNLVLFIQIR